MGDLAPEAEMTLQETIARAERGGIVVGVALAAPDARRFSHNGTRRFIAASTVKIAIMVELFRQMEAEKLRLDDEHRLLAGDKAKGSGVLLHLHDGITLTLGDLAYLMMSISDNTATNILIDRLGMTHIETTMRALGMARSSLERPMREPASGRDAAENWAIPNEYATLLQAILDGRAASPEACSRMVALLETQQNDRRIARFLPRDGRPRWGSKTGSLDGVINDVGFIMTERGPLVVAVFCEGAIDPLEAERVIGEIARVALEAQGGFDDAPQGGEICNRMAASYNSPISP